MRHYQKGAGALAAMAFGIATTASAQVADAGENTQASGLEEIIVTAQKRSENLQTVPVAISAVTAATFQRYASSNIADLSGAAPNVYIGQPTPGGSGVIAIAIRGIQYAENEKTIEPPIGVVLDGVYSGTAQGGLLQSFDLERIEILRGPQGTLFGKNTTGGALNAIRSRPTGKLGAKLSATIGTLGRREYRGVLNFPIVPDVLAGKIAVFKEDLHGVPNSVFTNRRVGDRDYLSVSGTLLFTPTEDLEMLLTYDHVRDRSESTAVVANYQKGPTVLPTNPPVTVPGETPCRVLNFCPPFDPRRSRINGSGIAHADLDAVTFNASMQLTDFLKFVAITGWRRTPENIDNDFDATELLIFRTQRPNDLFEQFSQELRLEGKIGSSINYVAGVYFFDGHYQSLVTRTQDIGYVRGNPALIGVYSAFFPGAPFSTQSYINHRSNSYAAFAQLDIDLTRNLTLTLGGRYTADRKRMIYKLINPDGSLVGPAQGALVPQSIDDRARWNKFTPRIALKYEFDNNSLAYASFTRGYNAGGYSGRAPDISTVGPYNPEVVDAYEVGFKTELLDRTLRLNVAAFRNDYKNKQEDVSTATTIPPYFGTTIANASNARIQGVEVEATAVPLQGLNLNLSVGYLDAKYKDFVANISGLGVTDNSNLKLRRAPKFTVTSSADYSFDLGGGTVNAGARYRFLDDVELLVTNDPTGHVKAGGFLDASLSYSREISGMDWTLKLYGRNLTDVIRATNVTRLGGFVNFHSFNRGREGGAELLLKF